MRSSIASTARRRRPYYLFCSPGLPAELGRDPLVASYQPGPWADGDPAACRHGDGREHGDSQRGTDLIRGRHQARGEPRWQEEVLDPIYLGEAITCTMRDWESGQVMGEIIAPPTLIRLLEGAGMFHTSRLPYLRSRDWVDCDLDAAQARGIERSLAHGHHEHLRLWRNVWGPITAISSQRFHPEKQADILYNLVAGHAGRLDWSAYLEPG